MGYTNFYRKPFMVITCVKRTALQFTSVYGALSELESCLSKQQINFDWQRWRFIISSWLVGNSYDISQVRGLHI